MQLVSNERKYKRKYRSKIIAENHLKKDAQRYIDFYVAENNNHSINISYKYLYFNYGLLHSILIKYHLNRMSCAMKDLGTSCAKVSSAVQTLATSLDTIT